MGYLMLTNWVLRLSSWSLFMFLFIGCSGSLNPKEDTNLRPNIIIIMADDLGYSDLGCFGGEINTPALDYLAENGLRFTSFYNTSRCCPSRASLLTGLYPHQAGIGRMSFDSGLPGYRGFLSHQIPTIAEILKESGYQTGMTGKWHVSLTPKYDKEKQLAWLAHQMDLGPFSDPETYPVARGFEKYFGNIWGVVDYFDPFSLVSGDQQIKSVPENYYHTDAIGDTAVAYIQSFARNNKPFFLLVTHCAPHWPLQAPEPEIVKYQNTYKSGWRSIREARYEKMCRMGLINKETHPLPAFMFPDLNWDSNADSTWDARAMAVHAAMVDRMDQTIQKLIDELKEVDQLDNTVIFFFSDNGASSERPSRYGPGFDRAGSTRSGEPVIFPVDKTVLPGPQTVHAGIGPVWAHIANTPYRYWKARVYEGGIRTPFIVHWPEAIKDKNGIRTEMAHLIDLMTTCLEIAEVPYPDSFRSKPLLDQPGKSLAPLILGRSPGPIHEELFWEHMGAKAFRVKDLKLVKLDANTEWELYDLSKDQTETVNIAHKFPHKLLEMKELWRQRADEFQVFPLPDK